MHSSEHSRWSILLILFQLRHKKFIKKIALTSPAWFFFQIATDTSLSFWWVGTIKPLTFWPSSKSWDIDVEPVIRSPLTLCKGCENIANGSYSQYYEWLSLQNFYTLSKVKDSSVLALAITLGCIQLFSTLKLWITVFLISYCPQIVFLEIKYI